MECADAGLQAVAADPHQALLQPVLPTHSPLRKRETTMAVSIPIVAIVTSLHLIAFIFAVGTERRRSTAKIVPDEYDERTYCVYGTDASTVYGLAAFGLLAVSQTVLNVVTRCLCCGKGLVTGSSTTWTVFFFVFSWTTFLGAEACLLAGSAKNAYHTKYRGIFKVDDLSCATLRKGMFAAGTVLTLLSLAGSSLYYWAHSKADTGETESVFSDQGRGRIEDFILSLPFPDHPCSSSSSSQASSQVFIFGVHQTSKVTKLCDLRPNDGVCSIQRTREGSDLSIGTSLGRVQVRDGMQCKRVRTMGRHQTRTGILAWNSRILASESRDRNILQHDPRVPDNYISKPVGHKSEVYGLKWSNDDRDLLRIFSLSELRKAFRENGGSAVVVPSSTSRPRLPAYATNSTPPSSSSTAASNSKLSTSLPRLPSNGSSNPASSS
ncbi:hypothetical protein ACFX2I_000298 [Malus domestica]